MLVLYQEGHEGRPEMKPEDRENEVWICKGLNHGPGRCIPTPGGVAQGSSSFNHVSDGGFIDWEVFPSSCVIVRSAFFQRTYRWRPSTVAVLERLSRSTLVHYISSARKSGNVVA